LYVPVLDDRKDGPDGCSIDQVSESGQRYSANGGASESYEN